MNAAEREPIPEVRCQTYTVTEVAQILGIGRNTAYECCRRGEIPHLKIRGRILIPRSVIDKMLKLVA